LTPIPTLESLEESCRERQRQLHVEKRTSELLDGDGRIQSEPAAFCDQIDCGKQKRIWQQGFIERQIIQVPTSARGHISTPVYAIDEFHHIKGWQNISSCQNSW